MRYFAGTPVILSALLGCAHSPTVRTEQAQGMDFPNDANGDVLRRMAAGGDDLSRSRVVEFMHVMPREAAARQMAASAARLGFTVTIEQLDDDDGQPSSEWGVTCSREMIPTHASITETEMRLDKLAKSLGGYSDGWGCFSVE